MLFANTELAIRIAIGAAILIPIVWALQRWLRRPPPAPPPRVALQIDVHALGDVGPAAAGPVLEFEGLPMRVAAVVVAHAGRAESGPPDEAALDRLYEATLPGLSHVVHRDAPVVRHWPPQLSISGFMQRYFQEVRLPGERGKGTPWSSVAGVVRVGGKAYLVGLVLRAAADNWLGQMEIESEGLWLRHLRVNARAAS